MRLLLPNLIVVCLLFCSVFLATPVSADFAKAYQDYLYNNTLYKENYTNYQVAKSTFLTYRTNSAENDAIIALRKVLQSRNQLMVVYYDLLFEKLLVTPGISDDYKTTFGSIRTSEQTWLAANKLKIEAAATLLDLNSVSGEFEGRYRQMDSETKQALGSVLLAKERVLREEVNAAVASVGGQLTAMDLAGEDTTIYKRNLIGTQNKLELFDEKMGSAQKTLIRPIGEPVEVFQGQQQLAEANQYLRDMVSSLLEIIRLITR